MQNGFDEKLLDENDPYFSELELKIAHDNAQKECLRQVQTKFIELENVFQKINRRF